MMFRTKIGFVPSNWEAWNGGNWAEGMRDRCVAVLQKIPGIDLVVPSKDLVPIGCVSSVEDARRAVELFRREKVQGLLIGNMDFGMEVAVGTVLNGLDASMPILHFCTRSGPISEAGARSTDTWCGQFMTVSAIKRRGFRYVHVNTCNPEEPAFAAKVESFVRAVSAISRFRGAKIGQLGTRPELFESQAWSEQAMQKRFAQMVVPMDLDRVLTIIEGIDPKDPEVKRVMGEITAEADVSEHTEESILNLARCEVGYLRIAKQLDVTSLAINCWTRVQERLHVSVCSVLGRLNEQGMIAACEVDVYGAATMWALYAAGLGMTPPDFIDWTDLHPSEPNVWLAWHCGNAAPSLRAPASKARLVRNERMIQWCPTCHGALEFRLKDGPVTCARMVEYDGEFTMFFGSGTIVDIPPFVRGAYGWVRVNDVADWESKMVEHGIIHHGVLIHDPKVADALELFCRFLGINAVRGA
jgi:L-fucose isomerase-like protein